jgi:predicted dehydrogenase
MKVAVIGVGHWGKNIARTLKELNALGGLAESTPEIRQRLAGDYPGVPLYDDYLPLLATEIPAVAIATPGPLHYEIARAALLAGKDVFVEKPMTLSVAEAEELVRLAEEKGRILMVGHLLLYQPAITWIKEYLAAGNLGEIRLIHQERLALGRACAVENVLWSLGVHDVASLLYLTGRIPTGISITGARVLQAGVEDEIHLELYFPGGPRAHLHASWLWPETQRRMVIAGSRGFLVYNELEQTVTLHKKGINPDLTNRDEGTEVLFTGEGKPLTRELEHFLECLATRKTPITDGRNGLEVIKVLEEAGRLLAKEKAGQ